MANGFETTIKVLAYCVLPVHFNSTNVFLILFLQPSATAVKSPCVEEISKLMWLPFGKVKGVLIPHFLFFSSYLLVNYYQVYHILIILILKQHICSKKRLSGLLIIGFANNGCTGVVLN